jgi:hypothetical protein
MDSVSLRTVEAQVKAQMANIDQVYDLLRQRTAEMPDDAPAYVESAAYQLHNLYSAIEDLLLIVAKAFENHVTDLSRWHTALLQRMTLEIRETRPALLSAESAALLNELRAFRHFFRHAYGVPIQPQRVAENTERAWQVRPLLERDVALFLEKLGLDPTLP